MEPDLRRGDPGPWATRWTPTSACSALGEDIGVHGGAFGVTTGLYDKFGPERVRDTPISEDAIVGAAVGAALCGMRPVAELQFSDFTDCAMDQLVNQAAKIHFMLGGAAQRADGLPQQAGSGTGAAAQHSQSLEAWFAHVPGSRWSCRPPRPRQGPAPRGDRRPEPGPRAGAQAASTSRRARCPATTTCRWARPRCRRGKDLTIVATAVDGGQVARRRGGARRRGHRRDRGRPARSPRWTRRPSSPRSPPPGKRCWSRRHRAPPGSQPRSPPASPDSTPSTT